MYVNCILGHCGCSRQVMMLQSTRLDRRLGLVHHEIVALNTVAPGNDEPGQISNYVILRPSRSLVMVLLPYNAPLHSAEQRAPGYVDGEISVILPPSSNHKTALELCSHCLLMTIWHRHGTKSHLP